MPKFFTMYNQPKVISSPSGEEVYRYSYLNAEGELCEASVNMAEKIKSCVEMTNYKRSLEQYGVCSPEVNSNARRAVYADTTEFDSGSESYVRYVQNLRVRLENALRALKSGEGSEEAGKAADGAGASSSEEAERQKK